MHVHDCTFQMVYVLKRMGHVRVCGPRREDDPQGRLHQSDSRGIPPSRDQVFRGFRGTRDRGAGELQDQDRRGAAGTGPGPQSSVRLSKVEQTKKQSAGEQTAGSPQGGKQMVRTVSARRERAIAQGRPCGRRDPWRRPPSCVLAPRPETGPIKDRPATGLDRRAWARWGSSRSAAPSSTPSSRNAKGGHPGTADRAS